MLQITTRMRHYIYFSQHAFPVLLMYTKSAHHVECLAPVEFINIC